MPTPKSIRDYLSSDQRLLPLQATIDPGFVHRRRIQTMLGQAGMDIVDECIRRIPHTPEWEREIRIDHIYKDVFLEFCRVNKFPTLHDILHTQVGRVFCSTESVGACPNFYEVQRAVTPCVLKGRSKFKVELHYSTGLVRADTLKGRLFKGTSRLAIVAELSEARRNLLMFDPLLMGFPWLRAHDPAWQDHAMWWNRDFFENFVEDFDEFERVKNTEKPRDISAMRNISERGFKWALGEILGDDVMKDWGGETSDHFTSHLYLKGNRVTAAFLLKGPAHFAPMGLNHLGKNNDQIVRLAREPAEVLVVQHCHTIQPAVRETLRAFAVRPHSARRYCLIDGRDSLWLLQAYGLFDAAIERSKL